MHQLNLQELRNKPRFLAPQLSVHARYRHWWSRLLNPSICPQPFDFNRYGMGLWSTQAVPEGTRLLVDLKAGGLKLQKVQAQVCNLRCIEGRYRVGVLFECHLHSGLSEALLEADLERLEKQFSTKAL